jgi:hypothetical protein
MLQVFICCFLCDAYRVVPLVYVDVLCFEWDNRAASAAIDSLMLAHHTNSALCGTTGLNLILDEHHSSA